MIKVDLASERNFLSVDDIPINREHDGKIFIDSQKRVFISVYPRDTVSHKFIFVHVPTTAGEGYGLNLGGGYQPSWPITLAPKRSQIVIEN